MSIQNLDVVTLALAKDGGGGGGGGTDNYNQLRNLPQVNGVTLTGNKSTQDLHISLSGSFTPEGSVNVTHASDTEVTVNSITAVGSLPSMTVNGETLVFDAGTLPTKGSDQTVIGAVGNISASFSGTAGSVTVS